MKTFEVPRGYRVPPDEAPPAQDWEGIELVAAVFQRARQDAVGMADTNPREHQAALRWFFAPQDLADLTDWCDLAGWEVEVVRHAVWRQLAPTTRRFVYTTCGYWGGRVHG